MNNDMLFYGRKVCFIGAHPDDIELGCGALIAHIAGQTDVMCLTLSDNQKNPHHPSTPTDSMTPLVSMRETRCG